mgnify:CR=1 FL=1
MTWRDVEAHRERSGVQSFRDWASENHPSYKPGGASFPDPDTREFSGAIVKSLGTLSVGRGRSSGPSEGGPHEDLIDPESGEVIVNDLATAYIDPDEIEF